MADEVLGALRAVLNRLDPVHIRGAAQLRHELAREMPSAAYENHRRTVRLVAAAVEENLPARLQHAAPISDNDTERLVADLARARGWTEWATREVVHIWAAALGAEADPGAPASSPLQAPAALPPAPRGMARLLRNPWSLVQAGRTSRAGVAADDGGEP